MHKISIEKELAHWNMIRSYFNDTNLPVRNSSNQEHCRALILRLSTSVFTTRTGRIARPYRVTIRRIGERLLALEAAQNYNEEVGGAIKHVAEMRSTVLSARIEQGETIHRTPNALIFSHIKQYTHLQEEATAQ